MFISQKWSPTQVYIFVIYLKLLIAALCKAGEFACDSGDQCVHWSSRCEYASYLSGYKRYEQCDDGSDDKECGMLS